jgi:hypothetical protein
MRRLRPALLLALAFIVTAPAFVHAGVGDARSVNGHITLWGPNRFGQQIAVVQDAEGRHWIARFEPGTLPAGAAVGTDITLVGRETALSNELDVVSAQVVAVSALPTGAASGWAVVPGAVQDASGMQAVIRSNGGAVITVDTSQLDADARTWLKPGAGVTVVGVYRPDGVLTARGVATPSP